MSKQLTPEILEEMKKYSVILITEYGSHLYGTETETSDTDYKGIFIPSLEDCIMGNIPKSVNLNTNKKNTKNSADDIDCELYSLQYFLHLCSKGETAGIDMLHTNAKSTIFSTDDWKYIQRNRGLFYTKSMKALVGYARKQAAMYGIKGSRLKSAGILIEFLKSLPQNDRLKQYWNKFPLDEHTSQSIIPDEKGFHHVNFCGKVMHETVKVSYALAIVERFVDQYGHRAKKAEKDGGNDWKALSHALRAAHELKSIYLTGDLVYPLEQADYLRDIKLGKFSLEEVLEDLESEITLVEELSAKSDLPETVDPEVVKDMLFHFYDL